MLISFLAFISINIAMDWWISQWTSSAYSLPQYVYPLVYLSLIVVSSVFLFLRAWLFGVFTSSAAYHLFDGVVTNLLRRPMSFFDVNPSGIILNRCIKDVGNVDSIIPKLFSLTLEYFFKYLGAFFLVCVVAPYLIVVILLAILLIAYFMKKYLQVATEF